MCLLARLATIKRLVLPGSSEQFLSQYNPQEILLLLLLRMSSTKFQSSLYITHVTTATAILEIDGVNLLTDPVFSPGGTKFDVTHLLPKDAPQSFLILDDDPALRLDQLPPIDGILLSHEDHDDNLDIEGRRLLDGRYVITTIDGAKNLASRPGVAGIKPWETQVYHFRGIEFQITGTPCVHIPGGESTGFILHSTRFGRSPDGRPNAIWFSGDTIYIDELVKMRDSFHIAAAVMNLGAAHVTLPGQEPMQITMGGEDAARLVREIGIERLVPMHFESWHHFTQFGKDLKGIFEKEGIMDKVYWLEPGQKKKII